MDKPIILLDIDDVVNALEPEENKDWWFDKDFRSDPASGNFRLRLSQEMADALWALNCDIRWLTTWTQTVDFANLNIGRAFGWPKLPALSMRDLPFGGLGAGDNDWKQLWVREVCKDPGPPVVWIDDDANYFVRHLGDLGVKDGLKWLDPHGRLFIVCPKVDVGIRKDDIEKIRAHLTKFNQKESTMSPSFESLGMETPSESQEHRIPIRASGVALAKPTKRDPEHDWCDLTPVPEPVGPIFQEVPISSLRSGNYCLTRDGTIRIVSHCYDSEVPGQTNARMVALNGEQKGKEFLLREDRATPFYVVGDRSLEDLLIFLAGSLKPAVLGVEKIPEDFVANRLKSEIEALELVKELRPTVEAAVRNGLQPLADAVGGISGSLQRLKETAEKISQQPQRTKLTIDQPNDLPVLVGNLIQPNRLMEKIEKLPLPTANLLATKISPAGSWMEQQYNARSVAWGSGLVARVKFKLWWLLHNCVFHPLVGLVPVKRVFKLHDWSGKILAGKTKK